MLRALGFNTDNVVTTIFLQALIFAVPGVCLGLAMAAILNAGLRQVMFYFTHNYMGYHLSASSVGIGILVGFVVPLCANYFPIRHALGKNLRKSLDINHRSAGELTVTITKLSDMGMSLSQLIIAILLIFLGIICYYIAPVSFLFGDLAMFFHVMNLLLIMMIMGMTFMSMLVQPYFEWMIAYCMVSWPYSKDYALFGVLEKNLTAHHARNIKTAMMFAVVMAFLIFAGTIF